MKTDTHHKSAEFTPEQPCTCASWSTNQFRYNRKILQGLVKNFQRTPQNFALSEISLLVILYIIKYWPGYYRDRLDLAGSGRGDPGT